MELVKSTCVEATMLPSPVVGVSEPNILSFLLPLPSATLDTFIACDSIRTSTVCPKYFFKR